MGGDSAQRTDTPTAQRPPVRLQRLLQRCPHLDARLPLLKHLCVFVAMGRGSCMKRMYVYTALASRGSMTSPCLHPPFSSRLTVLLGKSAKEASSSFVVVEDIVLSGDAGRG